MKTIELKHDPELAAGIKKNRTQAPVLDGIDGDVMLVDAATGAPLAVQVLLTGHDAQLADLSRRLRYTKGAPWTAPEHRARPRPDRHSGIGTNSLLFGFVAPDLIKKHPACSAAMTHRIVPELGAALTAMATPMWEAYQQYLPEQAAEHEALVEAEIHPDWRIDSTPFTSGITNHTCILPYHRDSGNLAGTWSMMLSLRRHVGGGCLHLPEYDATLAIPNHSVSIFNGQGLLHGVTPLVRHRKGAYRYTSIYYCKSGMRRCGCAADESKRAAVSATETNEKPRQLD